MKDLLNAKNSVLDVSKDPSAFFDRCNALDHDNELVVHDNTDPKYLYYQLLKENGHTFSWEYLEKGPEQWIVRITKHKDSPMLTLGQLAAADYRKAQVFKKYGLDFCFGGKKTLQEACLDKKLSVEKIQKKLHAACMEPWANNVNYNNWELDFMTDFIVSNHHKYVREAILRIRELSEKVVRMHASQYPRLNGIQEIFEQLGIEMSDNMIKEEQILFPFIRFLVQVKKGNIAASCLPGSVQQSISVMEAEHDDQGRYMAYLSTLTDNYTLPRKVSPSLTLLYRWLHLFENDLQQHVHLENNILFPKAIEVEKEYHEKYLTFKNDSALPTATGNRRDLL